MPRVLAVMALNVLDDRVQSGRSTSQRTTRAPLTAHGVGGTDEADAWDNNVIPWPETQCFDRLK